MGQAVAFQIKSFTFAGKHIYQDIRMKKVFKLAGGFMVGACIGFVGIIGVRVLVLGDSFDGLHSKFAETGMLETTTVQRNYPIGSVDLNRNHSSDVLV